MASDVDQPSHLVRYPVKKVMAARCFLEVRSMVWLVDYVAWKRIESPVINGLMAAGGQSLIESSTSHSNALYDTLM
jgi:hypothetical protein